MLAGAIAVTRGCGTRKENGVYAECPQSPFGHPVEYFLIDPVLPIDLKSFGMTQIGQKLFEREGKTHVLDWVGRTYYQHPTDWIEEVRRFGMSTRLELNENQYSALNAYSRLVFAHGFASMTPLDNLNSNVAMSVLGYRWVYCPKEAVPEHHNHRRGDGLQCAGFMWRTIEDDQSVGQDEPNAVGYPAVRLTMPSFQYLAVRAPNYRILDFRPALFAAFPILRIVVVNGDRVDEKLKKLRGTSIPVEVVEA